jgi:photosystem II stability/assembly factor-like uncharacterized protein
MPDVTSLRNKSISGPGGFFSGSVFFRPITLRFFRKLPSIASCALLLSFLLPAPCRAQRWRRVGPAGGEVISLAAADGAVYLGTPDGHVFASSDRGDHWQLRGRVGGRLDGVVQKIAIDSSDNNRLLAAVWFQDPARGGGVFESIDAGVHWSLAGLSGEAVRGLEQSESSPSVWAAGTRSGVFVSEDNARSWRRTTPVSDSELRNIDSLAIDPTNPQVIYVGTYHLPWKTSDGGKTWASIASGMIDDSDIMSLHIDAANPRRIFSSACSGIYRSEDAGASWIKLQGIPYASRRTQQIVQDPGDWRTLYAATTDGLWRTEDYGENWERVTPRQTVASAVAVLPPAMGSRVLAGIEEQGILRSDDGGRTFSVANQGFSHRVISSLAQDPRDPLHLLIHVAASGSSLLESRDAGVSWEKLRSPPLQVRNIYGASSGWWLAGASGGLARFDSRKGNWRLERFREAPPPLAAGRKSIDKRVTRRTSTVSPLVSAVAESGQRTFVASEDGLWVRSGEETDFARAPARNRSRSVRYLSLGLQQSLLVIAGNSAWSCDAGAAQCHALPAPANAGRLLWIREDSVSGVPARFVGTQNGVFSSSSGGPWQLLAHGLPAIASAPPAVSGSRWILVMDNGGFYQSGDSGSTWQRSDTWEEQGTVASVVTAAGNGFFIGSQSEGVLHCQGEANSRH